MRDTCDSVICYIVCYIIQSLCACSICWQLRKFFRWSPYIEEELTWTVLMKTCSRAHRETLSSLKWLLILHAAHQTVWSNCSECSVRKWSDVCRCSPVVHSQDIQTLQSPASSDVMLALQRCCDARFHFIGKQTISWERCMGVISWHRLFPSLSP